jgi:hypothetical protein
MISRLLMSARSSVSHERHLSMKHIIQDLCEAIVDSEDVRSYSGRGMYGEKCLGVVVKNPNQFLFELGVRVGEFKASQRLDMKELDCDIPKRLRIETDNMGMDMIVYFPKIQYVD